jgi:hypothetical protein
MPPTNWNRYLPLIVQRGRLPTRRSARLASMQCEKPVLAQRWLRALSEYRRSGQCTDISAISDHPVASRVWLMILGVDANACGSSRIADLK